MPALALPIGTTAREPGASHPITAPVCHSRTQAKLDAMAEQLALVGGSKEDELKRLNADLTAATRDRAAIEAKLGVSEGQLAAARAHGQALEARVGEVQGALAQVGHEASGGVLAAHVAL